MSEYSIETIIHFLTSLSCENPEHIEDDLFDVVVDDNNYRCDISITGLAGQAAAQLGALKEENERLKVDAVNIRSQLSQVAKAMAWEPPYQASLVERAENLKESNDALKARVAELEQGSMSKALVISRLQKLPDEHRMNMRNAEIIWGIIESINDGEFDFEEPANEG